MAISGRKTVVSLVGLLAFLIGCGNLSYYVEPEGDKPTTLFQSSRVFDFRADAVHAVIRSPDDWEAFIASYPARDPDYLRDRFWRVDYERHMVVGLALGTRGSGSIRVHIDSLRADDDQLVVFATEIRPAYGTRDFANPAHFVVVEKTDLPVVFADVSVKQIRRETDGRSRRSVTETN